MKIRTTLSHLFGLQPLFTTDANAYDYADSFDFTQNPLRPVPMVTSKISKATQQYLRENPTGPEDDDT